MCIVAPRQRPDKSGTGFEQTESTKNRYVLNINVNSLFLLKIACTCTLSMLGHNAGFFIRHRGIL